MSLQLANLFSLALTAASLLVFFVSLRKASRLMAMSRAVAQQVAGSAASLEQALSVLRTEREICRDEERPPRGEAQGIQSGPLGNRPGH